MVDLISKYPKISTVLKTQYNKLSTLLNFNNIDKKDLLSNNIMDNNPLKLSYFNNNIDNNLKNKLKNQLNTIDDSNSIQKKIYFFKKIKEKKLLNNSKNISTTNRGHTKNKKSIISTNTVAKKSITNYNKVNINGLLKNLKFKNKIKKHILSKVNLKNCFKISTGIKINKKSESIGSPIKLIPQHIKANSLHGTHIKNILDLKKSVNNINLKLI